MDTYGMDEDAVRAVDQDGYCHTYYHWLPDLRAVRLATSSEFAVWCNGTNDERVAKYAVTFRYPSR